MQVFGMVDWLWLRRWLPLITREINFKRGTPSWGTLHRDISVALFDNAVHGCKSKSRSLAPFFGGEEWLEHMRQCSGVHAGSGVGYPQHHKVSGFRTRMVPRIRLIEHHIGRLDLEFASRRHRVACIDCQVHNDLLDLPLIRFHIAEGWIKNQRNFDVLA